MPTVRRTAKPRRTSSGNRTITGVAKNRVTEDEKTDYRKTNPSYERAEPRRFRMPDGTGVIEIDGGSFVDVRALGSMGSKSTRRMK